MEATLETAAHNYSLDDVLLGKRVNVDNSSKWYKFFHFKIGQLSKVNTLSQQTKLKNLK